MVLGHTAILFSRNLLDRYQRFRTGTWWTEILNYFLERVTNGFVEGMNRALRAIIDSAFGYRNFENFRLQVLAEHGVPSG